MGMCARTQLAILDHNHNVGRQQATTLEGLPRFKLEYPKGRKRWVARPIKEQKSRNYLDCMLQQIVNPHALDDIETLHTPNLPDNIAPIPPPIKEEALTQHNTRFSHN